MNSSERLEGCFKAVFPRLTQEEMRLASASTCAEWDSLALVTLIALVEEEFGIRIPPHDIDRFLSFESILNYLCSKDKGHSPSQEGHSTSQAGQSAPQQARSPSQEGRSPSQGRKQPPATSAGKGGSDRVSLAGGAFPTITIDQYAADLARAGKLIWKGGPGIFWQANEMRTMVRRPDFCLDAAPLAEVRKVLRKSFAPLAAYTRHVDAEHPQNAWLYVCEDAQYAIEKLSSPARRDIRRALRKLRFEFIDAETLLKHGLRCFCDTRTRVGLSDGTAAVFQETYESFGTSGAHKILAAWAGDELAAYLSITAVDDWVDIFPYSANQYLSLCPNNGLIHVALDYFLVQRKSRLINYGLSSIQEVSGAEGLHAFKKKVGFDARPVYRAFVFHPFLKLFLNRPTLWVLRALRRLAPGSLILRKAAGVLALALGKNPMPGSPEWP